MENKYGLAAVAATKYILQNKNTPPEEAWGKSISEVFPESKSSREKGCPRNAYLGLCENGLIKGIPSGNYTNSQLNKEYAITAHNIIKSDTNTNVTASALWNSVIYNEKKSHNSQMNAVMALHDHGLFI